jgi:hypothetical protein
VAFAQEEQQQFQDSRSRSRSRVNSIISSMNAPPTLTHRRTIKAIRYVIHNELGHVLGVAAFAIVALVLSMHRGEFWDSFSES